MRAHSWSKGCLQGQVAVVTGAAQGIGRTISEQLAYTGVNLMLADLSEEKLDKLSGELTSEYGINCAHFVGDLSNESTVKELGNRARAELGPVDILVNCAGGGVILPFLEHTAETLKQTVDRNLWTVIWCTREFIPDMRDRKYGRVINLGADSVRNGLPDHAGYNAAKGGVHGLTTGLAREFAQYGVTVNTVAPCAVATPQLAHFLESQPELAQKFIDVIPLGRAGELDEIASAVTYLALPDASFITGQVLSVNGGSTML
ncbi:SDR family oxidoreductase [Marinobacter pelagius]|uniref:SDR family NAD(P)-dependent oxidoreductase n=1 Tax=Marinobacter sp. C7 TaxID=2951363 RepID=UPI001EF04A6E|nr:SDR family oxidoreductase [Marinobacter sp. C7]MCG7201508.1 SDR family oxidoreductase [Marinobacter sp. C7]